ncbi:uncharacterized protein LOC128336207 [Hemicordylus capensis]|uniref:uncharacterized protein LOC128336207 n=1 Tax=Hemicordylus capensis TaxID=884348 RepID=UPI002302ECC8|nr:uncharacterized protein LOC128336207 [Hemicordylus capensis]
MKNPATSFLLLATVFFAWSEPSPRSRPTKSCCFYLARDPVPTSAVKTYSYNRELCGKVVIIFHLTEERHVCANPKERWVQSIIPGLHESDHELFHPHPTPEGKKKDTNTTISKWRRPTKSCCYFLARVPVPTSAVKTYSYNRELCGEVVIIFHMAEGRHVCANPKERWVQSIIPGLQESDPKSFHPHPAPEEKSRPTKSCCFYLARDPVPTSAVKTYSYNRELCGKVVIIFHLTEERHVCANPRERWVQSIIPGLHESDHELFHLHPAPEGKKKDAHATIRKWSKKKNDYFP